jgi:hypothetical protein
MHKQQSKNILVYHSHRNPAKQNAVAAISARRGARLEHHSPARHINTMNCMIMARKDRTIKLFFNVTNASLALRSVIGWKKLLCDLPWEHQDRDECQDVNACVPSKMTC